MAYNPSAIIGFIRSMPALSPVTREVLISRLEHEPTESEMKRAREKVTGRALGA